MVIGVLQVELFLGDSRSLKDKRRVVLSLKDTLHQNNGVAVAEVDKLEAHQVAVLGIVAVSNSGAHTRLVIDKILDGLRKDPRFVLSGHQTETISGH